MQRSKTVPSTDDEHHPAALGQAAASARRPPTVVVTGAAGFIGSHAVLALLTSGYRVVAVDNLSRGFNATVRTLEKEAKKPRYSHAGGFRFYQVDLGNEQSFEYVLKKERPVAVLHFAGVAYAGESAEEPFRYYLNNTFNTLKVAEAMGRAGVKNLVYSSSCSTYGSPTRMPVTEETPQLPVSAYGRSKLQAEAILKDWEKAQNSRGPAKTTQVVLLRYFNVIGADPEGRVGERRPAFLDAGSEDYKLYVRLSTALFDAAEGLLPSFTIAGGRYRTRDGTAMRDYIHVVDLVSAHVAVLRSMLRRDPRLPNLRYYNVGTGKAASVREMADAAKRVTGVDFAVAVGGGRATDPPAVWADPGKLQREVGWRPRYLNLTQTLSHEWAFRQKIRRSRPSLLEPGKGMAARRLSSTELVDESGLSVASLAPVASSDGHASAAEGSVDVDDVEGKDAEGKAVSTGPGIPDAFEALLAGSYGGTGAGADKELGAARAVEALEKECGGWDADASQPRRPGCLEKLFGPLEQQKFQANRSMMLEEMDLVIPTIRSLDFLEDWREFIEGMHVIVVQDGDPDVHLEIPSWVNYELYNRRDIERSLGSDAWAISAKDSSIRIFGFLVSKKPYVFTLDDDVFPGRMPSGEKIDAPFIHYRNLKTPSTPRYFNTLYDPFAEGADFVRGYPFSLRGGVPTAVSHGLWLNTPDYDAPTQLLKPRERNTRFAPATMTVPHGALYSMCGMNMAFNRELIGPAFMFGLMGEGQPWGRYDDMWAGWASKVCADHLGVGVKTGEPYVNHSKASNPFVNLKKEYRGLFWQERIVNFFRGVKLSKHASSGPAACYDELADLVRRDLGGVHPYFLRLADAMRLWTSAWQGAQEGRITFAPSRRSGGSPALLQRVEPSCSSTLKLVINSHVQYGRVLPLLWTSLRDAGFTRLEDVVVFRGGAARDSQPEVDDRGVTFVNVTLNAFDYNALSGLYQHRDDPRVCARAYLYVLDTVEFDSTFPAAFDGLESMALDEVRMTPRPNSNILAFGHGVVEKYGTSFDRDMTKEEAVNAEHALSGTGPKVEDFSARVAEQAPRIDMGMADPYSTGHPRHKLYYPDLGITKYILWDQYGDISGDGQVRQIYAQ